MYKKHDAGVFEYDARQEYLDLAHKYEDEMTKGKKDFLRNNYTKPDVVVYVSLICRCSSRLYYPGSTSSWLRYLLLHVVYCPIW
jgi:hypothetical protein